MPNIQRPQLVIMHFGAVLPVLILCFAAGAIIILLSSLLISRSIDKTGAGTDPTPVLTLLQDHGIKLVSTGPSRAELLYPAPGHTYQLNPAHSDLEWLHIHVYPSEEAARTRAAEIRNDQRVHGMIDWIAPAHFFRCGDLIALYLGYDEQVTRALGTMCGYPFSES